TDGFDFRCDDAQVLGHDGQLAERLRCGLEERGTGTLHPAAMSGGRFTGRDLPVALEAAEMIEADQVHHVERGAYAVDPPAVAIAREGVPLVYRVTPELAGRAEVIGWDTGDRCRFAVVIETKILRVRPYVGAIVRD